MQYSKSHSQLGVLLFLALLFALPSGAYSQNKRLRSQRFDQAAFVDVGAELGVTSSRTVFCRIRDARAGQLRGRKRWASISQLIRFFRGKKAAGSRSAVRQIKRLRKLKRPAVTACSRRIACLLGTTACPKASPTIVPSVSPSASPSPSPTVALCPVMELARPKMSFPDTAVGSTSDTELFSIKNIGNAALSFQSLSIIGFDDNEFELLAPDTSDIAPNESRSFALRFAPLHSYPGVAELSIQSNACSTVSGASELLSTNGNYNAPLLAYGQVGNSTFEPLRYNVGGADYTDVAGNLWLADDHFVNGFTFVGSTPIQGTEDDELFQSERYGANLSYSIPLPDGPYLVVLHFAEISWPGPGDRVFDVSLEGELVIDDLDIAALVGSNTPYSRSFEVTSLGGALNLALDSSLNFAKLSAIEILPSPLFDSGHPYLRVLLEGPSYVVDYDGDGQESVSILGNDSFTHQPGTGIVAWQWALAERDPFSEGYSVVGSQEDIGVTLGLGTYDLIQSIVDSAEPSDNFSDFHRLSVVPSSRVPGAMGDYYSVPSGNLSTLLDSLPSEADYRAVDLTPEELSEEDFPSSLGDDAFIAVYSGHFESSGAPISFSVNPALEYRLFIDGQLETSSSFSLSAGDYAYELRVAFPSYSSLPIAISFEQQSVSIFDSFYHDERLETPFINSMPTEGDPGGGQEIVIQGFGFFPSSSVTVDWGGQLISGESLTVSPNEIRFLSPAGSTPVPVSVLTPNGQSNAVIYNYDANAPLPFRFSMELLVDELIPRSNPFVGPTQGTWGPDGRLYVSSNIDGRIAVVEFGDDYETGPGSVSYIDTMSGIYNNSVMGIAFNPAQLDSPLYISHFELYAHPEALSDCSFASTPTFLGEISTLSGTNFQDRTPLVTGLPASNYNHGPNGIVFNNLGDLLLSQGGNTNGGVASLTLGCLPESPLSAAFLRIPVLKPGFNGDIIHVDSISGSVVNDQRLGEEVSVQSGADVEVYASGARNTFDLVWHTSDKLYATDNGANFGAGNGSTGPSSEIGPIEAPDELLLVREGGYYGHPNRSRARFDFREYLYSDPFVAADAPNYHAALETVPPSTNGADEYRSEYFRGQYRSSIISKDWDGFVFSLQLQEGGYAAAALTGAEVEGQQDDEIPGLDLVSSPGGAIILIDYSGNKLWLLRPIDPTAPEFLAADIFPWRAPGAGGSSFVIGGKGFASLAETEVTFAGLPAQLTSVSPTRIHGLVPAAATDSPELVDIEVVSGANSGTIEKGFRYLQSSGVGGGAWSPAPALPNPLAETNGAVLGASLYAFGTDPLDPVGKTFRYDFQTGAWDDSAAVRPFPGDHHVVEAAGGRIFVIGGFANHIGLDPRAKVQIYDPLSDTWTLGADIPFAGGTGAASSAVIDGKIYYAGGIAGPDTVSDFAVYDPANDAWSLLNPMPFGRNHAAGGTDGRKFFVFGGRDGDEGVSSGFDDLQVFDPATGAWEAAGVGGSLLEPLPQRRGGLGKAAFIDGEFYVIGGESVDGDPTATPGGVYDRVDIYNPLTNSWRLGSPMPNPRHGLIVLAFESKLAALAGGTENGFSSSTIFDVLSR